MTDFPRGWTLNTTQNGTGVAASITVAATTGVVHVLDSLNAKIINYAAAVQFAPTVTVTNTAGVVLTSLLDVGPTANTQDSVSFTGLDITSALGGTIVVAMSGGPAAGLWAEITIQGHDI